jgi:hypothetical protein
MGCCVILLFSQQRLPDEGRGRCVILLFLFPSNVSLTKEGDTLLRRVKCHEVRSVCFIQAHILGVHPVLYLLDFLFQIYHKWR